MWLRCCRRVRIAALVVIVPGTLIFGFLKAGETTKQDVPPDYALGADDQIMIRSMLVKEVSDKQFRVDSHGDLNLPLAGRIHVAGRSIVNVEGILRQKFAEYYVEPDVAVALTEFRSEPVSVVGAVGAPGLHPARGYPKLLEVLASAGGIRPDAGPAVIITREEQFGPLPLPNVKRTAEGSYTGQINLKDLLEATDPALNISVRPRDVITIPRGQVIYVVGSVKRAGGFPMEGRPRLSVLEALSLAEGIDLRAAPGHAKILRASSKETAEREEIPVNLNRMLAGKAPDAFLQPNDILFVPNSAAKSVTTRSLETALQIGTGLVIWRR